MVVTTRIVDAQYRIAIPREICRHMGIHPLDRVTILQSGREMVIRLAAPVCSLCGDRSATPEQQGYLCDACRSRIRLARS